MTEHSCGQELWERRALKQNIDLMKASWGSHKKAFMQINDSIQLILVNITLAALQRIDVVGGQGRKQVRIGT